MPSLIITGFIFPTPALGPARGLGSILINYFWSGPKLLPLEDQVNPNNGTVGLASNVRVSQAQVWDGRHT